MLPVEVLNRIQEQLDWRGPNDKPMGHIVLKRDEAECLMELPKLIGAAIDKSFDKLSQVYLRKMVVGGEQ